MPFTDYGLIQIGSFLANQGPSPPDNIVIGFGSNSFVGSENFLGSEFLRKTFSWSFVDNNANGNVSINNTEANGSNINEFGLGIGASLGSNLYTRDLSSIGPKNNTFDVDMTFQAFFRRG